MLNIKKRYFKALLTSLFGLVLFLFSVISAKPASAAINLIDWSAGAGGAPITNSWNVKNISVYQAAFKVPSSGITTTERVWFTKAGVSTSGIKPGNLIVLQWINYAGIDIPIDQVKGFYTYSDKIPTYFLSDNMMSQSEFDTSVGLISGKSYPNQIPTTFMGSSTRPDSTSYWGIAGDNFNYVGKYSTGAGGQNSFGRAILVTSNNQKFIKYLFTNGTITKPKDGSAVSAPSSSGLTKSVTDSTLNKTTNTAMLSKSSTDDITYNLSLKFASAASNVYNTYTWAVKDTSYTSTTHSQDFQSSNMIEDVLPKGFEFKDVTATSADGRTVVVGKDSISANIGTTSNKATITPTTVLAQNVTNGTGKNYLVYSYTADSTGNTGGTLKIQFVAGDHTATAKSANTATIKINGKLAADKLPDPDDKTGLGQLDNTAKTTQTTQEYNRSTTSAAGTEPVFATFGASDATSPDKSATKSATSNKVTLKVQAHQLKVSYMRNDDDQNPTGNVINVPISDSVSKSYLSSGWVYPTLTTKVPVPATKVETENDSDASSLGDTNFDYIYDTALTGITSVNKGSNIKLANADSTVIGDELENVTEPTVVYTPGADVTYTSGTPGTATPKVISGSDISGSLKLSTGEIVGDYSFKSTSGAAAVNFDTTDAQRMSGVANGTVLGTVPTSVAPTTAKTITGVKAVYWDDDENFKTTSVTITVNTNGQIVISAIPSAATGKDISVYGLTLTWTKSITTDTSPANASGSWAANATSPGGLWSWNKSAQRLRIEINTTASTGTTSSSNTQAGVGNIPKTYTSKISSSGTTKTVYAYAVDGPGYNIAGSNVSGIGVYGTSTVNSTVNGDPATLKVTNGTGSGMSNTVTVSGINAVTNIINYDRGTNAKVYLFTASSITKGSVISSPSRFIFDIKENFKSSTAAVAPAVSYTAAWTTSSETVAGTTTSTEEDGYTVYTPGDSTVVYGTGKEIPNTASTIKTVNADAAILSKATYTGTWYHSVTDLNGKTHNNDQITNLETGKTYRWSGTAQGTGYTDGTPQQGSDTDGTATTAASTPNNGDYEYVMPNYDAALTLYYGQKNYDVNVSHFSTTGPSFDTGVSPIMPGTLSVTSSVNSVQSLAVPHVESYTVHEGQDFTYSPQVMKIGQKVTTTVTDHTLLASLNKSSEYNYVTGSNPSVDGNGTYKTLALYYDTMEAADQNLPGRTGSTFVVNPEKISILTGDASSNLNFTLDLSGESTDTYELLHDTYDKFDPSLYKYDIIITDGTNTVYQKEVNASDFTQDTSSKSKSKNYTLSLTDKLNTTSPLVKDGAKTKYKVYISPKGGAQTITDYTGSGTQLQNIEQKTETDTDLSTALVTYGFTSSKSKITSADLNESGQLDIDKDKLVVKTIASRSPYTYTEYHEYLDAVFNPSVTTLTGYSINGTYPVTYGIDSYAGVNTPSNVTSSAFELAYPTGLNDDKTLLPSDFDNSSVTVDSSTLDQVIKLTNTASNTDENGITSQNITLKTPLVAVEKTTGNVYSWDSSKSTTPGFTNSTTVDTANGYKSGGNRIYIPSWIKNVPSVQEIHLRTVGATTIGVNKLTMDLTQKVNIIGYMNGHSGSDTQSTDALLMQPVDRSLLYGNGTPYNYSDTDKNWLENNDWAN